MRVAAILGEADDLPVQIEDALGVPVKAGEQVIGKVLEAEVQDGLVLLILELDVVLPGLEVDVSELTLGD